MARSRLCGIAAVVLAAVLCVLLHQRAGDYFTAVATGGRPASQDFATASERARVGATYICLMLVYGCWLLASRTVAYPTRFQPLLTRASPLLLLALLTYPVTGDVRLYLHFAEMAWSGLNPWLTRSSDYQSQWSPFLAWDITSPYAPVAQALFMISTLAAKLGTSGGIYGLKAMCLALHIANAALLMHLLRDSPRRAWFTFAYLVNPVLLFEQVTNAHVDVLLCTTLLALLLLIRAGRPIGAALVLVIGFLAKTIPLIWSPLLGVLLVRERKWKSLALSGVAAATILTACAATILPSRAAWQSLFNPSIKSTPSGSMLAIASHSFTALKQSGPPKHRLMRYTQRLLIALFIACYASIAWRLFHGQGPASYDLAQALGAATLALFLFATLWYRPWYASVLVLLSLSQYATPRLCTASIALCLFSGGWYHLVGAGAAYDVITILSIGVVVLSAERWAALRDHWQKARFSPSPN